VFCLVHGLLISGKKINSEDVSESVSYVRLFSLSVRFGCEHNAFPGYLSNVEVCLFSEWS
jgi:hypothetical protein